MSHTGAGSGVGWRGRGGGGGGGGASGTSLYGYWKTNPSEVRVFMNIIALSETPKCGPPDHEMRNPC